ncbi:polysaccharide biosynthesis tyrosine autokinase [Rodentibacter genomosp. 2]|uniref:Polysaccharide biosynthesis protein GumC n=1 Tax=Rodentibacter genomosp. 2 TaxID=1908266 RepID=A0A1V3JIE9_9PAST|nr:polysaccharide biosynthesis tyrosine autokinase [Rodentibacter genomosp. 2]OOF56414.1 polysaccharide biosynthesis protein GumC [Rodentibacter genomosp. 2]
MMHKKQNDIIDLSKLLAVFWDRKKTILYTILSFVVLGIVYVLLAPSIYNANASVQVESKYTGGALKEISSLFEQESSAGTEIVVIKSRAILTDAIDELNLSTQISPKYTIPFFSKGWEKLFGIKPELVISRFIPKHKNLEQAVLEIGRTQEEYSLFDVDGKLIVEGKVGQIYDNDDVIIHVTNLKGESGKRFSLEKLDELKIVADLQKKLSVEEQGKLTGVISLNLNGEDKDYIYHVLRAITNSYIQHSTARNTAEAEKSLAFLEARLPNVRERLTQSENALNEYRQRNASVDLDLEAKSMLDTMVQLEEDLNALTIKESEISQRFKRNHPTYAALLEQRQVLLKEKARLSKAMENLPKTQKEIIRLTRDFESNQEIFVQLQNKIQELDVIRAGAVSNVRILDQARVMPDPIAPRKLLILAFSVILGGMTGCAIVIFGTLSDKGIKSSEKVRELGLNVYATIPYTKKQHMLSRKSSGKDGGLALLSEHYGGDLAIEALRGVRTDLNHILSKAKNNRIMLVGATARVGKGFISANLANLIAQTNQRVLFIDADLRRGYAHTQLHLDNQQGLSEILAQGEEFSQAVQQVNAHLHVITRGATPHNPAELLTLNRFSQLLEWASKHYDVVIISAPPVLAVTDAAIIAQHMGTVVLIGHFEHTTQKEIEASHRSFVNAGMKVKGVILNGLKARASTKDDYFHRYYG